MNGEIESFSDDGCVSSVDSLFIDVVPCSIGKRIWRRSEAGFRNIDFIRFVNIEIHSHLVLPKLIRG